MINIKYLIFSTTILLSFQVTNIEVTKIVLFKSDDALLSDLHLHDALDSKAHTTLTSGLPLRLILLTKIMDSANVQVSLAQIEILIQYDVWDEIFSITYPDRIERFRNPDSLKTGLRTLRNIRLAELQRIQPEQSYTALVKIHLQNDLRGSVIDSIDHGPSDNGFGLSSIIKFFFGSPEPKDHWYRSGKFVLNQLKSR